MFTKQSFVPHFIYQTSLTESLSLSLLGADNTIRDYSGRTPDDLLRFTRKKTRILFNSENGGSRKNGQESETSSRGSSLLARTASLRQTAHLFDKLPTMKYRTMK